MNEFDAIRILNGLFGVESCGKIITIYRLKKMDHRREGMGNK